MLNLTVKVDNAYSDGHTSEQTYQVDLGQVRGEEALWECTGDGHGDCRSMCAIYAVTILDSPGYVEHQAVHRHRGARQRPSRRR